MVSKLAEIVGCISVVVFLQSGTVWSAEVAANIPVVAAARVERGDLGHEVSFEAELRPYQEVELHARVSGYLETMKVDAGDLVKEGQVIATLDVPELRVDIEHALASERRSKAEIVRAKANYEEAHLNCTRMEAANKAKPNLIAQQDIDNAKARDRAADAAVDAATEQANVASADVKKFRTMMDYTQITVPFTGVITKRYADPGALIQAGTSTGTEPLVRLSENDRLRIVFPVSVSYVSGIKVGDPVEIRLDSTLKRTITGKVTRFSRKVETATRTMEVQVDVPNEDLSLTPGLYATALLKTDLHRAALSVPVQAVAREKGVETVYIINKDHKIEERSVKIGLELPDRVEIISGLEENELVLTGSRGQVKPGETVEAKVEEPAKTEGKTKSHDAH